MHRGTCCGGVEGNGGGDGDGDDGISGGGGGLGGARGGGVGGGGAMGGAVARSTGSHCGGLATPRSEGGVFVRRSPAAGAPCPGADNGARRAPAAAATRTMTTFIMHVANQRCNM